MMEQTGKEKKNKQIGAIISIGSHVAILLLFLFMVAWRAPDPPLPEIGIELNFGLDEAGSGEVQSEPNTTPTETESEEDAQPDGMDEPQEEVVEQEVTEAPTEEVVTPVTTTQESPDVVDEQPKEEVKEPVEKEEEVKEDEAPQVDSRFTYPGSGGKEGDNKDAQNANQGDKTGAVGDQGDKDGNEKLGNGGIGLNTEGWVASSDIKPEVPPVRGKIIFLVTIDNKGEVIEIKIELNEVGGEVAQKCIDKIKKATFTKKGGTSSSGLSQGKFTYIFTTK